MDRGPPLFVFEGLASSFAVTLLLLNVIQLRREMESKSGEIPRAIHFINPIVCVGYFLHLVLPWRYNNELSTTICYVIDHTMIVQMIFLLLGCICAYALNTIRRAKQLPSSRFLLRFPFYNCVFMEIAGFSFLISSGIINRSWPYAIFQILAGLDMFLMLVFLWVSHVWMMCLINKTLNATGETAVHAYSSSEIYDKAKRKMKMTLILSTILVLLNAILYVYFGILRLEYYRDVPLSYGANLTSQFLYMLEEAVVIAYATWYGWTPGGKETHSTSSNAVTQIEVQNLHKNGGPVDAS